LTVVRQVSEEDGVAAVHVQRCQSCEAREVQQPHARKRAGTIHLEAAQSCKQQAATAAMAAATDIQLAVMDAFQTLKHAH
jgi:hypothetical protein